MDVEHVNTRGFEQPPLAMKTEILTRIDPREGYCSAQLGITAVILARDRIFNPIDFKTLLVIDVTALNRFFG